MHIQLAAATENDAPLISALAGRIWRMHYPDIIGAEQVEYMLALLYSPEALVRQMQEGQRFFLPQADGDILGYLAVSEKEPGKYFLHKFYVDNGKRGGGLGSILFKRLLAMFPDLTELRLTVNRMNYRSINFYYKVGFIIESCVQIPIGGGFVMDDFQMLYKPARNT